MRRARPSPRWVQRNGFADIVSNGFRFSDIDAMIDPFTAVNVGISCGQRRNLL